MYRAEGSLNIWKGSRASSACLDDEGRRAGARLARHRQSSSISTCSQPSCTMAVDSATRVLGYAPATTPGRLKWEGTLREPERYSKCPPQLVSPSSQMMNGQDTHPVTVVSGEPWLGVIIFCWNLGFAKPLWAGLGVAQ